MAAESQHSLSDSQIERLDEVMRWYENVGRHLRPTDKPQSLDIAPVETYIAKANNTIAASCNGDFTVWGTSQGSTSAPTARGSTLNARDWCDDGYASGDKAVLVRGAGRLYAIPCGGQDTKTYGIHLWSEGSGCLAGSTDEILSSTGDNVIFGESSSVPSIESTEVGVSLASTFAEGGGEHLVFSRAGLYEVSLGMETQAELKSGTTTVTSTEQLHYTFGWTVRQSTGSTSVAFNLFRGDLNDYRMLGASGNFFAQYSNTFHVLVASSGHFIKVEASAGGSSKVQVALLNVSACVKNFDNEVTWATS